MTNKNQGNRRKKRVYKLIDKRLADNDHTREMILFTVTAYAAFVMSAFSITNFLL